MADTLSNPIIQQAVSQSIQSRVGSDYGGFVPTFMWLARAGANVSPWWSPTRDRQLGAFWKSSDHLSGALYNFEAKMTAIPFKILPKDQSIKEYVRQAEETTDILMETAEFGDGWDVFYNKFIESLITFDNGVFVEIIGDGDKAGPIVGMPISIAILDSSRCTRTGNAMFPVLYQDTDGKMYKLHYTRVMFRSQMPSTRAEMFGVGICAVSRCLMVTQELIDVLTYKGEKMGSRPHRKILVTSGGLDPIDVARSFTIIDSAMDSAGLSRYSKVAVVGSASLPEAGLEQIDLSSLPDGFNEETSVTFGMAVIALALGVDARELFPAMTAGATRADALLQHLKQRGKGPGQMIQITESLFNQKYLPSHLKMVFDFQDDAEDRQIADIKNVRSTRHRTDTTAGVLNIRVSREQMLADGDIDRSQFERLELADGRLDDGTSVLNLFYSTDKIYQKYLQLTGIDDPADIEKNNIDTINPLIVAQLKIVNTDLVNKTGNQDVQWKAYQSRAALEYLQQKYQDKQQEELAAESALLQAQFKPGQSGNPAGRPVGTGKNQQLTSGGKPARPHTDTRNVDLRNPNMQHEANPKQDNLRPGKDDRQSPPSPTSPTSKK